MCAPFGHRVVVLGDPHGAEYLGPEPFNGSAGALAGEDLFGPLWGGHGNYRPLVLALDGIAVGLQDLAPGHVGLLHFLHVHALHAVRVHRGDHNTGRKVVHHMLHLSLLPFLHFRQLGYGLVPIVKFGHGLVNPVYAHPFRPGAVSLLHHHLGELMLPNAGADNTALALLEVRALLYGQLGVFPHDSFFHV